VTSPHPQLLDLNVLRLTDALALIEHGGTRLPPPEAGADAYMQQLIDALCELSLRDPLTGLANRRHFHTVLNREIEIVARSGNSALLLMLDIDHFKAINDTHGHPAGDKVLQAVAHCIVSCVRPQDTVARYGGEEFAIVLPDCQAAYGEAVAERIRQSIAALAISPAPGMTLQVTTSVGGAFAPVWVRSTADLWTERADTQLYLAKAQGRNRVCMDHQQIISVSAEEKSMLYGALGLSDQNWRGESPTAAGSRTERFSG